MDAMRVSGFAGAGVKGAAKWGKTPTIQKKAENTAKSAMTEGFVRQLKAHAQKDAQKGVYMDQEFIQLQHNQMRQYVSPDRSGPTAQVTALLTQAAKEQHPLLELLDRLLGNCSGKIQSDSVGQTAEIYSPDGEMIASYNSLGGGWTVIQTKAEQKFLSEAATVYAQAFREARSQMKAAPEQPAPASGETMDIRA